MQPDLIKVKLGDSRFFELIRGKRITRRQIHSNTGDVPVISGHKEEDSYLGWISEEWLLQKGIPVYRRPLITINSNGSVGEVFFRKLPKYTFHDDVTALDIKNPQISHQFLVFSIREAIAKARFRYNAKLYLKRLKKLGISIPLTKQGYPDYQVQQNIASKLERLQKMKNKVKEFSNLSAKRFIIIDTGFKETISITLGDSKYFKLIRGKRVRKKDIHKNRGKIPVISASLKVNGYLGYASENWLRMNGSPIFEKSLITLNMDGTNFDTHLRNEKKYTINDVVLAIEIVDNKLDPQYIVYAIKEAISRGRFKYDAKMYKKRVKKLQIRVPVDSKGVIDLEQQRNLARKYEWLEELKKTIKHFALELENKFITAD